MDALYICKMYLDRLFDLGICFWKYWLCLIQISGASMTFVVESLVRDWDADHRPVDVAGTIHQFCY